MLGFCTDPKLDFSSYAGPVLLIQSATISQSYCGPGIFLGPGDIAVNKIKIPDLRELTAK